MTRPLARATDSSHIPDIAEAHSRHIQTVSDLRAVNTAGPQ